MSGEILDIFAFFNRFGQHKDVYLCGLAAEIGVLFFYGETVRHRAVLLDGKMRRKILCMQLQM